MISPNDFWDHLPVTEQQINDRWKSYWNKFIEQQKEFLITIVRPRLNMFTHFALLDRDND